mmetsp:Transcript_24836/g.51963  ORF Transcript_24836/g.51963 Transcript_24836/m.51963 type:complete len:509 (-) Transcript_24836:455-1981(-)
MGRDVEVEPRLLAILKGGAYFYKHDFGRVKRTRKWAILSSDGLALRWRSVGPTEVVMAGDGGSTARGNTTSRGLMRSSSFSRFTTIALSDVSHIIFGPYTDTFMRKTASDRVDPRWTCFSLVMRESRTVDFAAEDEPSLLTWLLGLQQLIAYFAPQTPHAYERWSMPKLQLQKIRLRVSGESDRTGQGPHDVVLSAVLNAAQDVQKSTEQATRLQAAWRRRNVQGKFQAAVNELMEVNGLIEGLEERERELSERQERTALKIEEAMRSAEAESPPPRMPSEKDMCNPAKMQEYMLQMGEYSARQQLKLASIETEVRENQQVTAEAARVASEKRQLQDMSRRLQFSLSRAQLASLSEAEAQRVLEIQRELGVTPRGSIKGDGVREVRLYKQSVTTRLGIIFHQSTPSELGDVSSDATPRAAGEQPLVLPVIKVLDKSGIAASCPDIHEGDQVLSVNGRATLSNIAAVQMLREATGAVVLAVRDTPISKTPRAHSPVPRLTGLRPLVQPS